MFDGKFEIVDENPIQADTIVPYTASFQNSKYGDCPFDAYFYYGNTLFQNEPCTNKLYNIRHFVLEQNLGGFQIELAEDRWIVSYESNAVPYQIMYSDVKVTFRYHVNFFP